MTDVDAFPETFLFSCLCSGEGASPQAPGCVVSSFAVRITHGPWVLVQSREETHVWLSPSRVPCQKRVAMGSNASLRSSIEFAEIGLLNNELFGTEVMQHEFKCFLML